MGITTVGPQKNNSFIPADLAVTRWDDLAAYFHDLLDRPLPDNEALRQWLLDRSALDAFVSECFAWRYINLTRDNQQAQAVQEYQAYITGIAPRLEDMNHRLNRKLMNTPGIELLENGSPFAIYLRSIRNNVELYREENVKLLTEIQLRSKEHGRIFAAMTVGISGAQLTLQKASVLLEEPDRDFREAVYHKINRRILQDADDLETIFDELVGKRHQMALNAGFDNFRDYRFRSLGRFDYTADDCLRFHNAIAQEIIPLLDQLNEHRAEALDLRPLRPWDLHIDASGRPPLRPFANTEDLTRKAIRCLDRLHPLFGRILRAMHKDGHLDLESRPGKRPGGYNMPLQVTGSSFIFMNAAQSVGDMRTLLHESGHAVHAFLTRALEPSAARSVPSEVAELAAMTMELLSMDHWDVFFDNEEDLRRARLHQLEMSLKVLPWIATIDKFQHWVYTHPGHTRAERRQAWLTIFNEFKSTCVDHTGLEEYAAHLWHKQLHLYEVPFYYIEYGMAQLGAIALWKQYREDPTGTVKRYVQALQLGYTRTIGEIYETAGIRFDFSVENVADLGAFVKGEIDKLTVG